MATSNWVFGNLDDLLTCYQSDTRIDKNMYQLNSLYLVINDSERRLLIDHTKIPEKVGSISGYAIEHIFKPKHLKEYKQHLMPFTPTDVKVDILNKKMMFKPHRWLFWKSPEHTIQIDRIYGNVPNKIDFMLTYPLYDYVSNRLCWIMPFSPY